MTHRINKSHLSPALAWASFASIACLSALLSGCAHAPNGGAKYDQSENLNRRLFKFNDDVDKMFTKPLADAYAFVTPKIVRTGVTNFFSNLGSLNVILNDLLQGKFKNGLKDTGRFTVNTTIGVLGLGDPASRFGLEKHEEDFGQTLATWGVGEGSYWVLPMLGPSVTRDIPGLVFSSITGGIFYLPLGPATSTFSGALNFLNRRAGASETLQAIESTAVDPYIFMREGYLQHRNFLIYDGKPPIETMFDEDLYEDEVIAGPKARSSRKEG